jgi:two-component system sensor histidine kinase PilS (NtrC family)
MRPEGIYRKLRVLITFRVAFVSILLGAFFVLQLEYNLFPYQRIIPFIITFIFSLNIIYLLILRHGEVNLKLFAYAQLVLDVVLEIVLIIATGGIESWFTIILLLTVIASAIVIDKKAGYFIAILSGILYGIAIDLQYYKIIPVAFSNQLTEKDFIYNISINLLAVCLTAYLIGYLTSGLETTKRTLDMKSSDLKELSQFHTDVIENIPSGLFSADIEGKVRLFNMAAEQIIGIKREKAIDLKINDIFKFVEFPVKPDRYRGVVATENGLKNIGMSISEQLNQKGQPVGYIGTFQDLTEIVRLENEMKRREKFAAIGELSASIAHEIRNPLASIKGSIEMIKEGKIGETHKERLMEIAINEISRLNGIVTNFLNYSDPKPLSLNKCDIGALLANAIELLRSSLTEDGGIEFMEKIDMPLYVLVDEDRLGQVIWNLLKNAVDSLKGRGTVSVRAWRDKKYVFVEISDTGEGIKEQDIERIFYPFYTTKKDGTGLGLAIAYRIVDEHHGNIDVKSEEGEGTTFTIDIPVQDILTNDNNHVS